MVDTRCSFQEGWTLSSVSTSCHFLSGLVYDTIHQQSTPFAATQDVLLSITGFTTIVMEKYALLTSLNQRRPATSCLVV
jgi:hypothetical protein